MFKAIRQCLPGFTINRTKIGEGVKSQGFKVLVLLGWVRISDFDKLGFHVIMFRVEIKENIKQWREKNLRVQERRLTRNIEI